MELVFQLSNLPPNLKLFPSLVQLSKLNSIDLNENQIKNIPDGVQGLQITELSLNQNQISAISPGKSVVAWRALKLNFVLR